VIVSAAAVLAIVSKKVNIIRQQNFVFIYNPEKFKALFFFLLMQGLEFILDISFKLHELFSNGFYIS
jgi:hypothetical protein